ncbi:MAG TPA: HAD-IB family phosphatase [Croceibacterium sp.]|nr:HAD-IB family phosphatase [Croceibacterium sp.]
MKLDPDLGSTGAPRRTPRTPAQSWTAVVLAGSRPGSDPLAQHFRTPLKAMVPVCGEPMVGRVVRTLLSCASVGRVVVLAQQPHVLTADAQLRWLEDHPLVEVAEGAESIAATIAGVVGTERAPWPVLVTTADHPLLTREAIEHFLAASAGFDASMGIVEHGLVTMRYPESRRTWIRFGRSAYNGANLFTLQGDAARSGIRVFGRAESSRKKKLKVLWYLGPAMALAAASRMLSLDRAIPRIERRLGFRLAVVKLPFAEAAIDVDRLADHALAERIIAARPGGHASEPQARISVFDLDRTLTRYGTYTAFLTYAAHKLAPWRLLLLPLGIGYFLSYRMGRSSRKELKERLQRLILGRSVRREAIAPIAERYARRLRERGFLRQGLEQIEEERRQGRSIVIATAANSFYVDAIARELAVDQVVCTASRWHGDTLVSGIDGPNCYGDDKLTMLRDQLERHGFDRARMHVRFFSDDRSDACTLSWADQAFVVNPKNGFGAYAAEKGWPVLHWR